jgi:hypothetical protein
MLSNQAIFLAFLRICPVCKPPKFSAFQTDLRSAIAFVVEFPGVCPITPWRQKFSPAASAIGANGQACLVLQLRPTQLAPARQPARPVFDSPPLLQRLTSTTFVLKSTQPSLLRGHFSHPTWQPAHSSSTHWCILHATLLTGMINLPHACSISPPLLCLRLPILPFSALGISLQPTNVAYVQPVQSQVPRRYQS